MFWNRLGLWTGPASPSASRLSREVMAKRRRKERPDTFREFASAAGSPGLLRLLTPYYDRVMPSMGKMEARLWQGIPIQSPELENQRSLMVRYPRPKGKKRPGWMVRG